MNIVIAYYGPNDSLETISALNVHQIKIQPGELQGYGGRIFFFCGNDIMLDHATGTFPMAERILDKMVNGETVYLYVRALNNYKISLDREEYHVSKKR